MPLSESFTVADAAELAADIKTVDRAGGDARRNPGDRHYNFDMTGSVTLVAAVDPISLPDRWSLTIAGHGHTLDMADAAHGLIIRGGTVTIEDLTIAGTATREVSDGWGKKKTAHAGQEAILVRPGGTLAMTGVTLDPAAGGTLTLYGNIRDPGGDAGTGMLVIGAGDSSGTVVLKAAGASTYSGGTVLNSGTLDLESRGAAGTGTIHFAAATRSVLAVGAAAMPVSGGTFTNTLADFSGAATLDLADLRYVPGRTSAHVVGGNTLVVGNGFKTIDFLLSGSVAARYDVADPSLGTLVYADPLCFLEGTMIATPDGEVPVETLKPGDLVRLADGGVAAVRWVGYHTVVRHFTDPVRAWPVRIRAGALAENVPCRDLLLSPSHAVRLDDVLVHAAALVNGVSVLRERAVPERFVYWHVELDTHTLILAENVAAETFLDGCEELAFDNRATRPEPEAAVAEMPYPRCKSPRQLPRHLRALLTARAAAIGAGAARAA
jgi:autotransporter-associated beta strand protein